MKQNFARYLYPKLSAGGYAIIDDYGGMPACEAAVDEYRPDRNCASASGRPAGRMF
jgi:hypothetical protein